MVEINDCYFETHRWFQRIRKGYNVAWMKMMQCEMRTDEIEIIVATDAMSSKYTQTHVK